MQSVLVKVESIQTDEVGKREEISFSTTGQLYQKKLGYYLRYIEELNEEDKTATTLKIQDMVVTLIRDGKVRMKQEFEAGESSSFEYKTPYGDLNFELIVKKVETEVNLKEGSIRLEYELRNKGDLVNRNQLTIKYKEDTNG
ncbi:MAG: hypothetical protein AWU54_207 [Candidatus Frackibacter sp. T328-2]|nr:MAG: hypothetical protein AWU54_207 [Candidatus Frackibacter sp. T328-2]